MSERQIVFDEGELARTAARGMIENSPIADKVIITSRDPGQRVMVITDVTGYLWNSSEESLWEFLKSLSGRGSVNLEQLAARMAKYPGLTSWVAECFLALLGLPPMGESQPGWVVPTGRVFQVSGVVSAASGATLEPPAEEQVLIENVDLSKLRLALEAADGLVEGS